MPPRILDIDTENKRKLQHFFWHFLSMIRRFRNDQNDQNRRQSVVCTTIKTLLGKPP